MYKVKIRRVLRTGLHHSSSSVIKCATILSKQTDSSVRHWFSSKFTAARPPFSTWLLRNWVESKSRPIRKKTPCSEKSGCLTVANLDFDFEIGNSEFSVKHEIQKRFSTLRNPFSKWISWIFMFCVFPGNPKRISSKRGRNQRRNPFSLFISYNKIRYLYFKILIRIYQSKAPRTLEQFSQYSTSLRAYFGLFWIEIRLFL